MFKQPVFRDTRRCRVYENRLQKQHQISRIYNPLWTRPNSVLISCGPRSHQNRCVSPPEGVRSRANASNLSRPRDSARHVWLRSKVSKAPRNASSSQPDLSSLNIIFLRWEKALRTNLANVRRSNAEKPGPDLRSRARQVVAILGGGKKQLAGMLKEAAGAYLCRTIKVRMP